MIPDLNQLWVIRSGQVPIDKTEAFKCLKFSDGDNQRSSSNLRFTLGSFIPVCSIRRKFAFLRNAKKCCNKFSAGQW